MAEKYTREQLVSFTDAIRSAAGAVAEVNPSFYIVSLNGGLPLFDVMSVLDRNVDSQRAIYLPGSSKINNCADVLTNCFENFFLEKRDQSDDVMPLVSLDEVVSGRSVERLFNSYNAASRRVMRAQYGASQKQKDLVEFEALQLRNQFPLSVFGIREIRPAGSKLDQTYLGRVKKGEVREYFTDKIITMDDPDYQTVEFAHPNTKGFVGTAFQPRVQQIILKRPYLDLLADIARYIGVDPETVHPERTRVVSDCDKYSRKPQYNH